MSIKHHFLGSLRAVGAKNKSCKDIKKIYLERTDHKRNLIFQINNRKMGKNNLLSITLDNITGIYHPCQVVSGDNKLKN